MYFNLNKNKADALDHYTTKHAHISGVFCPICYKNFQSIGAAKKHNIRQNCLFNDSVLQRNKAIFAQWNEEENQTDALQDNVQEGNQTENKGKV